MSSSRITLSQMQDRATGLHTYTDGDVTREVVRYHVDRAFTQSGFSVIVNRWEPQYTIFADVRFATLREVEQFLANQEVAQYEFERELVLF